LENQALIQKCELLEQKFIESERILEQEQIQSKTFKA